MPDDREHLIRKIFAAYLANDRQRVSDALAEDFRFTSPFDDGLDNASCALLFAPSQHLDGQTVTCDSVENTATYTQCNNLKIQGLYMANGVYCAGWSPLNATATASARAIPCS